MRKRQLEIALSRLRHSPSPNIAFEAYDLDPNAASKLLLIADKYQDIADRTILDLGCGSGILAIGSALLGGKEPFGIDINKSSIETAKENAKNLRVHIDLVIGDIAAVRGRFDTSVMNPPFGTRRRGTDIMFLRKALQHSKVTYSLHKMTATSRQFLLRTIANMGGHVDALFELEIGIPRTYSFHTRRNYTVAADLYRIISLGVPQF